MPTQTKRGRVKRPGARPNATYRPIIMPRPNMLRYAPYEERLSRASFILIVYSTSLVFALLALLQWEAVVLAKQLRKLFNDNRYIFIGLFLIAAVLFTLFILIRALRHVLLINWLISILIVEFFILGAAVQAPRSHPIYMVSCIVIILLLFTVFILIASYMYCDLTEQVAALFLFCVVLLFVSLIMLMIFVLPRHWDTFHWDYHSRIAYYYFDVYRMILSLIVLMFVMYHAQLINGWRYAELRTKEGLLGSLILFSFFLIMYMLWCEPGFLVKPTVYFSYQIHDHKLKTTTARTTPAPHNTTLEST